MRIITFSSRSTTFKWMICTVVSFLFLSRVNAQNTKWKFETDGIVRSTDLDWSIAGNLDGQSPNILSELIFSNINAIGTSFKIKYNPTDKFDFFVSYQKLWTYAGTGLDTDYEKDDRVRPTYQQEFTSHTGSSNSVRIGGTYYLFINNKFKVGSGIQFRNFEHKLFILQENLPDLNSTYIVNSKSLGLSLCGHYYLNEKMAFGSNIMYSILNHHSKANWNLIDIFEHPVSFTQKAVGYGLEGTLNFNYFFKKNISMSFGLIFERQTSSDGKDKSYLKDKTTRETKFNGLNLNSKSLFLRFSYFL
ncbi:hypothetical protein [Sphingobacterium sp.]|uniref:hypothetical protein n=1 Tax=Sphingobacterium sp. TaxID=341027 RepID=UPI0028A2DAA1|nr:hypothetical protein [Sphingobacterium sp.]